MSILLELWPWLTAGIHLILALCAAGHAVMRKRDTRAAIGWVGLIWLTPLIGSLLYFSLGINRIRRRGTAISHSFAHIRAKLDAAFGERSSDATAAPWESPAHRQLVRLVSELTNASLLSGNRLGPLVGGEQAYPAMLAAIDGAQHTVSLCSYIFDNDRSGSEFIDALARAQSRGVQVRVLVDAVGLRYTKPTSQVAMLKRGLMCAAFMRTHAPRLLAYANLRNHRKIMVVDGKIGFTGGMNIREGCRLDRDPPHPVQDLHFRVAGPVVAHLQKSFVRDWAFTTRELLTGHEWFPDPERAGSTWARGISHGPDEDFERLHQTILGAITVAQSRIIVCTPYFLPDVALVAGLRVAAMRGVDVRIVLPARNNIKLVHWASRAMWWQLLERGCRIFLSPPPFDHTKLMLVDNGWSLLGSTNWDPRALRLNFEFNVECYDPGLNAQLSKLIDQTVSRSREVSFEDVERRGIPTRLLDGTARLLSPYL